MTVRSYMYVLVYIYETLNTSRAYWSYYKLFVIRSIWLYVFYVFTLWIKKRNVAIFELENLVSSIDLLKLWMLSIFGGDFIWNFPVLYRREILSYYYFGINWGPGVFQLFYDFFFRRNVYVSVIAAVKFSVTLTKK